MTVMKHLSSSSSRLITGVFAFGFETASDWLKNHISKLYTLSYFFAAWKQSQKPLSFANAANGSHAIIIKMYIPFSVVDPGRGGA